MSSPDAEPVGAYALQGRIHYTSTKADRQGQERGRESFRIDVHADGSRTIAAHGEIDDAPSVMRDVISSVDPHLRPTDCFVRLSVADRFGGTAWFRFDEDTAECEAYLKLEGRFSQRIKLKQPLPAFGNHAMINDGFLMHLYDLSKGPGVQVINGLLLSSPDHRGATGPMLFPVDLAIEFVGPEQVEVAAGVFDALHFRMADVPGLPLEHPPYDLWCTSDGDYVLLRARVGGYMQTAYELLELNRTESA